MRLYYARQLQTSLCRIISYACILLFLTVRPNTTYQDCIIDNKSHYQVLVSVVTFRVYAHIFHMNSYVSASTGNTAQIIFLILFSILIMFCFSSSKWKPFKGNFGFRITKMLHGTEFGDCRIALILTLICWPKITLLKLLCG